MYGKRYGERYSKVYDKHGDFIKSIQIVPYAIHMVNITIWSIWDTYGTTYDILFTICPIIHMVTSGTSYVMHMVPPCPQWYW